MAREDPMEPMDESSRRSSEHAGFARNVQGSQTPYHRPYERMKPEIAFMIARKKIML